MKRPTNSSIFDAIVPTEEKQLQAVKKQFEKDEELLVWVLDMLTAEVHHAAKAIDFSDEMEQKDVYNYGRLYAYHTVLRMVEVVEREALIRKLVVKKDKPKKTARKKK